MKINTISSLSSYTKATVPNIFTINTINTVDNIVTLYARIGEQLSQNTNFDSKIVINYENLPIVPIIEQ